MGSPARPWDHHPGSVRVLGLDMDDASVVASSLVLSVAGDTCVEALQVFNGERAQSVVRPGLSRGCKHRLPVRVLGAMVSEVATRTNAIAFRVATHPRDPRIRINGAFAFGPILGLGMALGIPVIPLASATIEYALTGRQGASCAAVAAVLDARIIHLAHELASIHEHQRGTVINATAAAVIGLEELAQWRVPAPPRPL